MGPLCCDTVKVPTTVGYCGMICVTLLYSGVINLRGDILCGGMSSDQIGKLPVYAAATQNAKSHDRQHPYSLVNDHNI